DASGWAKTTYLSGTVAAGDVFTITLRKTSDGSTQSYSYTAGATDGIGEVLSGLRAQVNADTLYTAQEDVSRGTARVVSDTKADFTLLTSRGSVSAPVSSWAKTSVLSGTPTANQVWTVTLRTAGGTESYSYTSASGNKLDDVGTGLATAISNGTG